MGNCCFRKFPLSKKKKDVRRCGRVTDANLCNLDYPIAATGTSNSATTSPVFKKRCIFSIRYRLLKKKLLIRLYLD